MSTDDPVEKDRPRVVIVDPDPLARRVVRDALQDRAGFIIPAEAADGVEAQELVGYYKPDIALVEVSLPKVDGVELIRRVTVEVPETAVLVFSQHDEVEQQLDALSAGAVGFISKQEGVDHLAEAALRVMQGEAIISPGVAMRLIERLRTLPSNGTGMRPIRSALTSREWEVVDLMCNEMNTREIAEELVLSEDTIYTHIKNVLRKLGVHSRAEAIEAARQMRTPGACRPVPPAGPLDFGAGRGASESGKGTVVARVDRPVPARQSLPGARERGRGGRMARSTAV